MVWGYEGGGKPGTEAKQGYAVFTARCGAPRFFCPAAAVRRLCGDFAGSLRQGGFGLDALRQTCPRDAKRIAGKEAKQFD